MSMCGASRMANSIKNIVALLLLFTWTYAAADDSAPASYNSAYPLTSPLTVNGATKYRVAIISDVDELSKVGNRWVSYLKKGYLTYDGKKVSLDWDSGKPDEFWTDLSADNRGAELSELVTFNGKLVTVDDKTGIVYQLDAEQKKLYPFAILAEDDGQSSNTVKAEWATVKDGLLYVGTHGSETLGDEGKVKNHTMQWVNTISPTGEVKRIDWLENYNKLRQAVGAENPGYLHHEAVVWSSVHKRWYFLPRDIASAKTPTAEANTNMLISCDADFSNIKVTTVGSITYGFSGFKFIPGSGDNAILAIKSQREDDGKTATYVTAFTTSGEILLQENQVAVEKYEGVEFI